jgi:hypothetical protein
MDASLPVNMELTIGGEDVDFLARLRLDRDQKERDVPPLQDSLQLWNELSSF